MRVLHVSAGNLYGGVESLLVGLARRRRLCADMSPAFAVCFEGRLASELTDAGVRPQFLGEARVSRPWTVSRARRELNRLLQRDRPDVVVCHESWPHALFASVVRAHRLPLVFWAHDLHAERRWLERWAARTEPNLVLANSRATQAGVKTVFPRTASEVVYLPVPDRSPADRESNRHEVRNALKTPLDAVVVVLACRLERWKGHALLLEALGRLDDVPEWTAWIAGGAQRPHERTYLEELRDQAARLGLAGRVQFLGQRTDVPQLLAAADVYCQPNLSPEPFGVAFVEAMYAGLPVVTTALGGALEIIGASCGLLVPPGRPDALAEALRGLIADPKARRRLGNQGPYRAAELCNPARQMLLLHRCLEGWEVRPAFREEDIA